MFNFIKSYIKENILKLSIFGILSLSVTIITLLEPLFVGKLINIFIITGIEDKYKMMYRLVLIIFFLYFTNIILSYILNILTEFIRNKLYYSIIKDMIKHIQSFSILHSMNENMVSTVEKLNRDSFTVVNFVLQHFVNLIINIISFFVIIIMLFYINSKVLTLVILTIPAYCFIYTKFKNTLFSSTLDLREKQNEFFASLLEQLNNIKFLKTNVIFTFLNDKLEKNFKLLMKSINIYARVNFSFSSLGIIISKLLNILILVVGGIEVINGNLTIGLFSILNSYVSNILNNISYFIGFSSDYQDSIVALSRLKTILSIEPEKNGHLKLEKINSIKIENLNFMYEKNKEIFSNFSFKFEKNNIYIIKGPNGTGKSTLINLILGLYNNYTGSIKYNDINLQDINMNYLRKDLISVVDQEPLLINDNFINNITFGEKNYNNKSLYYYINLFNLNCMLQKEIINEDTISGGQKQKISIIRSLIREKGLLIFDEPTSALDKNSVEKFKNELLKSKYNKIIIIVSHDIELDDIADEIIVL